MNSYEDIKNMNKVEMEEYLIGIYNKGIKEGRDKINQEIEDVLYWQVLMKTKGVGPALRKRIMSKFREVML